jgi:hypothetical protein
MPYNPPSSFDHSSEAEYYRNFPWEWFITCTFARPFRYGDDEARSRWKGFMDELELRHRDTIGRLVAEESRHASGALAGIRLHFHALLVSNAPISELLLRDLWKTYAGNGKKLIDVQKYDASRGAVEYCLKLHGSFDGETDFYNLDLYSDQPPEGWNHNSQSRRRWVRHLRRRAYAQATPHLPLCKWNRADMTA